MSIPTSLSLSRESLSARDFDRIRKLAYDYCGLDIEAGKEELVASRVGKIMRTLNIPTFGSYYDYVVGDKTSQALVTMIDSLTTNHTSFFREQQHFDFLNSTVFPALAGRPQIGARRLPAAKNLTRSYLLQGIFMVLVAPTSVSLPRTSRPASSRPRRKRPMIFSDWVVCPRIFCSDTFCVVAEQRHRSIG